MRDFSYQVAGSIAEAKTLATQPETMLLAGGTTLVDLAKCNVERPAVVVDITALPGMTDIELQASRIRIGALAKMSDVARHPLVARHLPALTASLDLAASAQIRNMASIGGNLLQRTRCAYFRDPAAFVCCNKRRPGSGCAALGGVTHNHAILGTSPSCIATYAGDMAIALTALSATIHLDSRDVEIVDLFLCPLANPERETVLEAGELIVAISVPVSSAARNSRYLKVRDRQSYEFAAASAAVALAIDDRDGSVREIRVAVGGVATRPWRLFAVEAALAGRILTHNAVREAATLAAVGAFTTEDNRHKPRLLCNVVERAIMEAAGLR
ncbi:FAD-binding molybdopterin dehydrogenase [Rhizobium sp. Leaf321]|uniref:FAD binding domain-containing protein n=1 Tax=Rhizobium sp. Leaf321 TaxID=1736335 RepID=UPI000715C895|nr:xanthine dehydrogenase family protein subunit M [Rhizobium sp. Leaf321]KQQ74863.1 FAD-binding molybdopterin dehydrogenase [Rhizobium sp. Leaf321]